MTKEDILTSTKKKTIPVITISSYAPIPKYSFAAQTSKTSPSTFPFGLAHVEDYHYRMAINRIH